MYNNILLDHLTVYSHFGCFATTHKQDNGNKPNVKLMAAKICWISNATRRMTPLNADEVQPPTLTHAKLMAAKMMWKAKDKNNK